MKERLFIGRIDDEEFYISLKDKKLDGWSFMGVIPHSEDELREMAKEIEPEDVGFDLSNGLQRYFNYELFYEDMEEDWYERIDCQGQYTENKVIKYLSFSTGTDIIEFLKNNDINFWDDFNNTFDYVGITKKQFYNLLKILRLYKKNESKGYKLFELWSENISQYPDYADEYVELPKENNKLSDERILAELV